MAKLTSRTLATGATLNDLIHIVITGDTSQSIDGSSYKATLRQLVPLFGGSPDVFVTGGTASSSGGTITFRNTTGGTFTVSGLTTPFTGGSGNCITSFYTNNIHACTNEITVHNRVQSTGSDAQNTLSFAFGDNVQALSDFSHAEGVDTIASGDTSHAEGSNTKAFGSNSHSEGTNTRTGTNTAYLATGLTSGVLYLSSVHGNVTANYTNNQFIWIDNSAFAATLFDDFQKVSGTTFSGGRTIIYLYDTGLSTTGNLYVGDTGPSASWLGNQTAGGRSSASIGFGSEAIGTNSFAGGQLNYSFGRSTFSTNKGNYVFGDNSCGFNNNNKVAGTNSTSFGTGNLIEGEVSFILGATNIIKSDDSFVGGRNNVSEGLQSFIFSYQSVVNSEKGAILAGSQNFIESGNTNYNTILGGESNTITGLSPSDPVYDSSIIGGSGNTVQSYSSVIVGGEGNYISGSRSVIIGGSGMTKGQSDTVYVPKFTINFSGTPSSSADPQGDPGSIMWDNTYLYYKDNTGWKRLSGATF